MKLSSNTIGLLTNFSNISGSMMIDAGNIVSIMSAHKNIIGYATVNEKFPEKLNIPQISRFLNIFTHILGADAEIEFLKSGGINISEGNSKFYLPPCSDKFVEPYKGKNLEFDEDDYDVRILLESDVISNIRKSQSGVKMDCFFIRSEDGKVFIGANNNELGDSGGEYKIDTGMTTNDDFDYNIDLSLMNLYSGDYQLDIFDGKVAQFTYLGDDFKSLKYWVSLNSK